MADDIQSLAGVVIPPVPAPYTHHPISISRTPKRYRPFELTDVANAETGWVGFFEKVLVGIFWKTGAPVPYVFKTANGDVRSLDAGCVKFLRNRTPREVEWTLDPRSGTILTVSPTASLQARYAPDRTALIESVSWRRA